MVLSLNKVSRPNVRVRVRGRVVRIEVEKTRIRAVIPVPTTHQDSPSGVGVHGGNQGRTVPIIIIYFTVYLPFQYHTVGSHNYPYPSRFIENAAMSVMTLGTKSVPR